MVSKMIFVNPSAKANENIPNVGLAYAATHFNVKVIDLNTMPDPPDRLLKSETDILGISVQSRTFSEAKKITKLYKEKYPDSEIKSVSGFLDVQCCYPYLDFEEKIEYTEPFSDNYPFPNYELFDSFPIFGKNWRKGNWAYAIMTSQGCPYQCVYCASRNRKWLARSPKNCFEELKQAKEKWGIEYFVTLDDCFNVDKERVTEFCKLIKSLNLKWSCANGLRADRFDEETARIMKDSGCWQISFGIESTASAVLQKIKKGETFEQIEQAIDIAKKYYSGENINGFFIVGLPNSSYEKDLTSLKWAKEKGIHAHFSFYIPFDKQMQYDSLFYGENAKPLSNEYPKELQMKVYELAQLNWIPKKISLAGTVFRKIFK